MRPAMGQWLPWSWPWSPPPATSYEATRCMQQGGQWINGQCVYPWGPLAAACSAQGGQFDPATYQCRYPQQKILAPCMSDVHCPTSYQCVSANCEPAYSMWGTQTTAQATSWWRSMFG